MHVLGGRVKIIALETWKTQEGKNWNVYEEKNLLSSASDNSVNVEAALSWT